MEDGRIFYLFSFSNAYPMKIYYVSTDLDKLIEYKSANSLNLLLGGADSWEELEKNKLNKGNWEEIW